LRACHLCEAACGLEITVTDGAVTRIAGDPLDPLSHGHICPKGTALADLQSDPDRLRTPMRRVGSDWQPLGWDEALDEVAARLADIRQRHGADAVAYYRGNPSAHNLGAMTHQSGFVKALGSRNIFSASTVDQIPHQLVAMWMLGHNFLIPVPDIDRTQLFLMLGANPLASNGSLWTVPGVRQRIAALKARGGRLVVIDPRRTETAQAASEHHFIRPGTDAALLVGLLLALDEAGRINPGRLAPMLTGWDEALAALRRFSVGWAAARCGLPETTIRTLAHELSTTERAVVYGRMGLSTQAFGSLCQWLILLLNIAIGALDREGGMMFTEPAADIVATTGPGSHGRSRSRVSGAPEVLGEYPVGVLAEEILTPGAGQVRGLVTFAGNPVLSNPNGRQLDTAFASLEFMVSLDMYINETTRHAHIILPPCGPLEKAHYPTPFFHLAVRNVARYSAPVFAKPEDARDDWEILDGLARRLAARFDVALYPPMTPQQMLDIQLKMSGKGIDLAQLEANPHGIDLGPLRPVLPGRLKTPDQCIACAPAPLLADLDRLAATEPEAGLLLIGRRHLRSNNSWLHNSARLIKGPPRCTLMMHPDDARARNLGTGSRAVVSSRVGTVELEVEVTDDIMPGVISIPHGFGHDRPGVKLSVAGAHAGVSVNDLTDERRFDAVSGNAAVNGVPVEVRAA
jgi:anaerobic selenocysteine-containing dehydrogenase